MKKSSLFYLMGYQKVAFTLDQVRKASKLTMKNKGFTRGGQNMNVDFFSGLSFSPMARRVPTRARAASGPAGPMYNAQIRTPEGLLGNTDVQQALQGVHPTITPQKLLASPRVAPREGITLGGGQHGTQSGALRGLFPDELLPRTPAGKEVMNRLGILHEGWEAEALRKPDTSMFGSIRKWSGNPQGLNTAHLSPSVILNENNALATLPQSIKNDVLPALQTLRRGDSSWGLIQEGLGRELPYGSQRFSRHAKKRMLEALHNPVSNDKIMSSLLGQ